MITENKPNENESVQLHRRGWSEFKFDSTLRMIISGFTSGAFLLLGLYFFYFLVHHSCYGVFSSCHETPAGQSWFLGVIQEHFAATISVPLSGISAICVVLTLKATTGPIEFEAWGLKFRGASGPLVLWIFVFAAFVYGVKGLWKC